MLNVITVFIGTTLMYSSPLVLAGLGSVISERSGVVNLGIEGMMTIGAFTGAAVGYFTGNAWLGFILAGVAAGVFAIPHAFACITCRADQTISGMAYNLVGPGLALFLCRILFEGATQTHPVPHKIPKLFGSNITRGALGNLNVDLTVVIGLILAIIMFFFLYKTKWGLHILAVGEHPAACDTLGINVSLVRYLCVIASGFLAGLGGACITLAITAQFMPVSVSGQGFIAIAAVIFGKWTPHGAYGACILFGAAQALVIALGGGEILAMLPYVITLVVLVIFVGHSVAPKASGKPYVKGER